MAGAGSQLSTARNAFARKVMVPHSLDGIINTVKASKPRTQTIESQIAQNKKNFDASVYYEDNAKGSVSSQQKLSNAQDVIIS